MTYMTSPKIKKLILRGFLMQIAKAFEHHIELYVPGYQNDPTERSVQEMFIGLFGNGIL